MECWEIENDLCRCCHNEGSFRLLSEMCRSGEGENYSDQLRMALNIHLKPEDAVKTHLYTICNRCILRLQDAISFRQQVIKCEEQFQDVYNKERKPENALELINDTSKDNKEDTYLKSAEIEINGSGAETKDAIGILEFGKEELMGIPQESQKENETSKIGAQSVSIDDGVEIDNSDAEMIEADNIGIIEFKRKENTDIPQQLPKEDDTSNILGHIKPKEDTSVLEIDIDDDLKTVKAVDATNKTEELLKHTVINEDVTIIEAIIPEIDLDDSDVEIIDENEEAIKQQLMNGALVDYDDLQALMNFATFIEDGKPAYSCCECGGIKTSISLIQKHTRNHLDEINKHSCPECEVKLVKKDLIKHRRYSHGVVIPTCKTCGFKDIEQTSIDKHERMHNKKKFPCQYCGIEFYQRALKKHLYEHNPYRPFGCLYCSKRYSTNLGLRAHMRMTHFIRFKMS